MAEHPRGETFWEEMEREDRESEAKANGEISLIFTMMEDFAQTLDPMLVKLSLAKNKTKHDLSLILSQRKKRESEGLSFVDDSEIQKLAFYGAQQSSVLKAYEATIDRITHLKESLNTDKRSSNSVQYTLCAFEKNLKKTEWALIQLIEDQIKPIDFFNNLVAELYDDRIAQEYLQLLNQILPSFRIFKNKLSNELDRSEKEDLTLRWIRKQGD